jgi:hypothetical protein
VHSLSLSVSRSYSFTTHLTATFCGFHHLEKCPRQLSALRHWGILLCAFLKKHFLPVARLPPQAGSQQRKTIVPIRRYFLFFSVAV